MITSGGTTTLGLYDNASVIRKKADITYVDSRVDPLVGGHKGFATLAQAQAAQGTLPAGSVVEVTNDSTASNNGLYLWNGAILTKSAYDPLTQSKTYTDLKTQLSVIGEAGKNLFNLNASDVALGNRLSSVTGNLVVEPSANASGFIPVVAGLSYSVSAKRYWDWYDSSKVFISGTDSTDTQKTKTAPANAAYMRVSAPVADWNLLQVEQADSPTAYEPYSSEVFIKPASVRSGTITGNMLIDSAVLPTKTNFISQTTNLFDKSKSLIGYQINGDTGTIIANATYDVSDFIPVESASNYTSNYFIRFHAYFTKDRVFMSGGSNTSTKQLTPPADAKYVRLTTFHTDIDRFQLEIGAVSTNYVSFGYVLQIQDGTKLFAKDLLSNWAGKTWATLGDSITQSAHWQKYVIDKHQLTWTNFGVAGTKISGGAGDTNAMCQDARINAIPTDVDLITLMGGTNDWAQSIPLGTITSTDPTTFYGALNTFAQKAFARWSTKRIAIATTPYGEIPAWESRSGWTDPSHNALGLTTNDYAEAIRIFCRQANIACIEVAQNAGYGTHNITEALGGSTTDHLHPSSSSIAAKGIGAVHISALNQIAPVA